MKFIEPSVTLWKQGNTLKEIWEHVARCARVCYQSEQKDKNEDAEGFVRRVIFRHSPDNNIANHLSVLEHGTVYMIMPSNIAQKYNRNPYSVVYISDMPWENEWDEFTKAYVTTNLRVLVENEWLESDKQFITPRHLLHSGRVTLSIITDIGVSRELNRHRTHSVSEESTRYCNYSKNKFGKELTFIMPAWYSEGVELDIAHGLYINALNVIEDYYIALLDEGWVPQKTRQILPLNLKTQVVHTAFVLDWLDFLKLRLEEVSGKVHPNMKVIAELIKKALYEDS